MSKSILESWANSAPRCQQIGSPRQSVAPVKTSLAFLRGSGNTGVGCQPLSAMHSGHAERRAQHLFDSSALALLLTRLTRQQTRTGRSCRQQPQHDTRQNARPTSRLSHRVLEPRQNRAPLARANREGANMGRGRPATIIPVIAAGISPRVWREASDVCEREGDDGEAPG
jgi:hypothetical protein